MFHHFPGEPEVGRDCLVRSTGLRATGARRRDAAGGPSCRSSPPSRRRGTAGRGGGYATVAPCRPSSSTTARPTLVQRRPRARRRKPREPAGGLDGDRYRWVDLDGEGVSGVLTRAVPGAGSTSRNLGDGRLGPRSDADCAGDCRRHSEAAAGCSTSPATVGSTSSSSTGPRPASSSARRTGLGRPTAVPSPARRRLATTRNLRFVDLTGDGHADMLDHRGRRRSSGIPSLGEDGFGAGRSVSPRRSTRSAARGSSSPTASESHLPRRHVRRRPDRPRPHPQRRGLLLAEPRARPLRRQGDDGRRAVFDEPDQFDPRRLRLADIDGSGHHRPRLPAARRRAAVRQPVRQRLERRRTRLDRVPRRDQRRLGVERASTCSATARPAWCGRRRCPATRGRADALRRPDGRHEAAPAGRRAQQPRRRDARSRYAPSTRFYLADKAAGRPWVTRLPFPVHVVERVETRDLISRQPVRHPLRLPPRLLRRRRARVPRVRHGRAVGHRGARRRRTGDARDAAQRRRRVTRAAGADRTWFHTGASPSATGHAGFAARVLAASTAGRAAAGGHGAARRGLRGPT